MDSSIFATLASDGLVRRAEKALQKSTPELSGSAPVAFQFEGQCGTLDLVNPSHSRCDCAASGVCKHIIAATLYAWQQTSTKDDADSEAGISVDMESLLASAGKVKVRQLYRQSQLRWQAEISSDGRQVQVNVDGHNIHFGQVSQLSDIVFSSASQKYALLAVYLWLQQQAQSVAWPQWLLQEQQRQQDLLQQSRQQLQQQCLSQLLSLAQVPLAQLRQESLLEIELLQIPMEKAGFAVGALKRLCGSLAHYISGEHIRDNRQVLSHMAQLLAMLQRDEQLSRDEPPEAPPQQLLCLGGYPWQQTGGAHGLTLVLQDEQGRFVTLAESRASAKQRLNYRGVWHSSQLLDGAPAGSAWLGHSYDIFAAELNGWNRLRQLQDTHLSPSKRPLTPLAISDIDVIDWQADYLCFAPRKFHQQQFDEAAQVMRLSYRDVHDNALCFSLPWSPLNEKAIANMALLEQQLPQLIIAKIERDSMHWHLRPIAVKLGDWFNLYFDSLPAKTSHFVSRWFSKYAKKPPLLAAPQRSQVQQLLLKTVDELAQTPQMPHPELAKLAHELGLLTLAKQLNGTQVEHRLQASYCAEQLLQLSAIKPILRHSQP
ncbi:hypothetical protein L9G74_05380 [Shewanella sp. C32]|uniref:SWIM-type domain-containing protein n=1 Tax=Shewanella electrica TaxID=515560 RepID=A0ABT2FHR1_9GAMM|nr:hypothetical protein [Shewanella electrica]MCH1923961.1 hypothetical protein [Shewanella electrica]MCS4555864.1 hypothetical protein [Shewanella electrica]